jgi:hypothetical protein
VIRFLPVMYSIMMMMMMIIIIIIIIIIPMTSPCEAFCVFHILSKPLAFRRR